MTSRIASAAVALPLLVLVIWAGSPWFTLLVAVAAAVGALELCQMARQRGRRPMSLVAAGWAVAMVAGSHFMASGSSVPTPLTAVVVSAAIAGFGTLTSLVWLIWRSRQGVGLADWAISAGAALYAGGLLAYGPLLRGLDRGGEWIFFLVLVTFAADTSAFFTGRRIGKRQLAPTISPGKTWEGAMGGLLAAMGVSVAAAGGLGLDMKLAVALVLGALMGGVGQVGDLVESWLKRLAGVKDSGWLIPGHGGVLDRLDSIVFNLVLLYHFVIWAVQ